MASPLLRWVYGSCPDIQRSLHVRYADTSHQDSGGISSRNARVPAIHSITSRFSASITSALHNTVPLTAMLAVLSSSAHTFIVPLPAASTHTSRAAQRLSLLPSMTITVTGPGAQLQTEYEEEEPTAKEWASRIQGGLNRLYPRRAVTERKGKATTVAIRDLAECSWEEILLPPIPTPAARRCLSELSWEDRCLPPMGTAAHVPGRLSELSWEDRVLPTLVPVKLRQSGLAKDELSWEERCLPSLTTVGIAAGLPGSLSELAWEDRLLP